MDDRFSLPTGSADCQKLMESLGIRHSLADVFHYRDYRYGKFEDAVGQARRDCDSAR